MNRYLQQHWLDTNKAREQIGVSNQKILKLLAEEGMIYEDEHGYKKVTPKGKNHGIRWQERQCYYNRKSRATVSNRYYTVIQLNPTGIEFVKQKLREKTAA